MSTPTWLSVLEMAGNASLTVLSLTGVVPPGSAQLAIGLETAAQNLIDKVKAGGTPTDAEIMAGMMLGIATLNGLKMVPGIAADKLAQITEYLNGAMDAVTAYHLAALGLTLDDLTDKKPLP